MKKKKLTDPQWKDLDPFILSKIFSHMSLQDQLCGPPFVCHSWLSASLHSVFNHPNLDLCSIQNLDDHDEQIYQQNLARYHHLLKLAIKHCKNWVSVCLPCQKMPDFYTLMFVAENTPNISRVVLPCDASIDVYPIFMAVMYWKNLQIFDAPFRGIQMITQLVDYCNNIVELGLHGEFSEKEINCIVEGFPRLKVLDLSKSTLSANALSILLDGRLKCIKELNVLHCLFVDEDGKDMRDDYVKFKAFKFQIFENISRIKRFMHCLGKSCQQCLDRSLEDQ
ncbi:F-box/LRR-repeat protein [Heracleum sosnowskyi]|uniref:F-box/LRR-repeat protein n=1 Tax=Heracleum sosnowskyi TaxID=360622 RepID=A0AAD8NCS9_9APIA|nr:F-box/LRR-repeat protein [Heracleum sosnowskyi]